MSYYERMSDDELKQAAALARATAHNAPFAEYNLRADGTASLRNHTDAYARHARDWTVLQGEIDRRAAQSIPKDTPTP